MIIHWTNAVFHTLVSKENIVSDILTKDGMIIATGHEASNYSADKTIDLDGMHIYPAFTDVHMHLIGYGRKLALKNLENTQDKKHALNQLHHFFDKKDLHVEGYFNVGLTKHDLDKISIDYAVILRHNDYHSFTVNSYVLSKLKINHATGIMIEQEALLIMPLWSKFDDDYLHMITEKAINQLYQYGVTTILSDDLSYFNGYLKTKHLLKQVIKEYPLRFHALIHESVLDDYLNDSDKTQTPFFNWQAVKTFYDGTLSSKSALLKKNYKQTHDEGVRIHERKDFENLMRKARDYHLAIAIHTIGDAALHEAINNLTSFPPTNKIKKDRIIHASLADMHEINRLKALDVVLDLQPQFITSDLPWMLDLLTHKPSIYPFKSYHRAKLKIGFSSDAPVEEPNPLLGIYAATYRRSNHDKTVYQKDESLTRYQALRKYTIDAAKTLGYNNKGYLKVGYLADFIGFKSDIMVTHASQLKMQKVLMTIINAQIVYKRH